MTQEKYETRLILFIDFLGFREIVDRTTVEPGALALLLRAMDIVGGIGDGDIRASKCVSQFSDSMVVSYRVDEESAVFWLLNELAMTIIDVASLGFLVRGAMTVGPLLHDDKHLVGPAMVRAYEMESKEAKWPRVIIDPAVIDVARRYRSELHTPDDEAEYVQSFLTKDSLDGRYFIDYVSWEAVVDVVGGNSRGYDCYLAELSTMIRAGLEHPHEDVREKFLWLHPQYLAAVELAASTDADANFRRENPGVCEAIELLPRWNELAESARVQRTGPSTPEKLCAQVHCPDESN